MATIMEEEPTNLMLGSSINNDGKKVVTSAQVLPRKLSVESSSRRNTLDDELTLLEKELFKDNTKNNDNKSETNTIINELFGEELERMDRERLASRYDVVDLKDLEPYRDVLRGHGGHGGHGVHGLREDQRISRRKHRWDENVDTEEEDFANILAESTTSTKQPPIRAKHL